MSSSFLPSTAAKLVQLLNLIPHPEGGFFRETFRSGSIPMRSQGQTDFDVTSDRDLVLTTGRSHCRPDGDVRRNGLTSIYWLPTKSSPTQPLIGNYSDHVHYYQGGLPMQYTQYDVETQTLETVVLGPDIRAGHVLQYAVKGGNWKCAQLVTEYAGIDADYSIVSEAVGPAFDFCDFHFCTADELDAQPEEIQTKLRPFLHATLGMEEIKEHYDNEQVQQTKTQERL